MSAEEAMLALFNSELVRSVALNVLYYPDQIPNDSLFPYNSANRIEWFGNGTPEAGGDIYTRDNYQWGLNNTGVTVRWFKNGIQIPPPEGETLATAGADIQAVDAWDIRTSAQNRIVAVIDDGVRYTHEDLFENIWTNPNEIAGDGLGNDSNGYIDDIYGINPTGATPAEKVNVLPNSANPVLGHGTMVAGIIGARGNNARGVAGVAWNTRIMVLKAGVPPFTDSALVSCVNYAVAKGAHIINMSLGSAGYSQNLRNALQQARNAGIIVVATAGNNPPTDRDILPRYPGGYDLDNIITVGLTNLRDEYDPQSSWGATSVDLGAPGDIIVSTYHASNTSYKYEWGTSFAAPFVSGACALLGEHFPADNYQRILNRVLASTERFPQMQNRWQTEGRLNLRSALVSTTSRPANDDFDLAFPFGPNPVAASAVSVVNNINATAQAGEPSHVGPGGAPASRSVWWKWTPNTTFLPSPRLVEISARQSSIPVALSVYTGTTLSSLTRIAYSSDGAVAVSATAGTTYRIAVDNSSGNTGTIYLSIIKDRRSSDFNRDGHQDILYEDSATQLAVWYMNDLNLNSATLTTPAYLGTGWKAFGTGDMDGLNLTDIALQHDDGSLAAWIMTDPGGVVWISTQWLNPVNPGAGWKAIALGDFDLNVDLDILFQHSNGDLKVWFMNETTLVTAEVPSVANPGAGWRAVATGHFDLDGKLDILFQHDNGDLAVWYMNRIQYLNYAYLNPYNPGDPAWRAVGTTDQNRDGKTDILFQHSVTGNLACWQMNGINLTSGNLLNPANPGGTWKIVAP